MRLHYYVLLFVALFGECFSNPVTEPNIKSGERNAEFIFLTSRPYLEGRNTVLEIGSGHGYHAVYIGRQLPELIWQTSDQRQYHELTHATFREMQPPANVLSPIEMDVSKDDIPADAYDVIFTVNTLHTMPGKTMERLFQIAGEALKTKAVFIVYGPFMIEPGLYWGEGNQNFDAKIRAEDPEQGLRDLPTVIKAAKAGGFALVAKHEHETARNYLLVFEKE